MSRRRLMMIGLDGFELSVAERMMAAGRLPALQRLQREGASLWLDHGPAKRTGLAWEHISTGLCPEDAGRWSAVSFDKHSYRVRQEAAIHPPFPALLDRKCVVFDPPYFRLDKAAGVRGVTNWGAHDPGTPQQARPGSLIDEMRARFGDYPAKRWIYGFCWPSTERSRRMARDLPQALDVRTEHALWLFGERLPDWELAIVATGEYHSAIEALWHGEDPDHPLHKLPTAAMARAGIEAVYEAGDRMIARLMDRFPDADFVAFSMHGMGTNKADAAALVLLPELLHRHVFGEACLDEAPWDGTDEGVPILSGETSWESEVGGILALGPRTRSLRERIGSRLRRALGLEEYPSLDWMLSMRYQRFWSRMPAFSLPAYYDGQIRINLKGRERHGIVALEDYEKACDAIETLLRDCRESRTGEPIVAAIERLDNPMTRSPFQADMIVELHGSPLGFTHPRLGRIGPVPYKRTGGHTGRTGIAWFHGAGLKPGFHGTRSAFDVVPTVIDRIGAKPRAALSGTSFLGVIAARSAVPTAAQDMPAE